MEMVLLALIAMLSPFIMVIAQAIRDARKERREAELRIQKEDRDNKRQDEVAERALKASRDVLSMTQTSVNVQKETARLTAEATERTNAQLQSANENLQKIHTLVNSDMTAARTAERTALKLLVLALRKNLGKLDDTLVSEEIDKAEKRITELDQILADRLAAQRTVDEQSAAHAVGENP